MATSIIVCPNCQHQFEPTDAIREEVMASRGEKDRAYILRLIRTQRLMALGGRVVMLLSIWFLPAIGAPLAGWPQLLAVLGLASWA